MIQIIIPAAGKGQRFKDAGYTEDKPDIPVLGRRMVDRVIDNLSPDQSYTVQVVRDLPQPTGGAVETILKADISDDPLLIGNCDQLAAFDVNEFLDTDLDGRLVVFKSNKPHHSYVQTDNGLVINIKEKEVISYHAVTGIYYFKSGRVFMSAAEMVIEEGIKTNGEFYVSSVIDKLIEAGYRIGIFEAPTAILGTPEELQLFEMAVKVGKTL